jgi:integrase
VRSLETIGARRELVREGATIWTVPAGHVKGGKERGVALSPAASGLARRILESHESKFPFPGGRPRKPLSNMAMAALLVDRI